MRKSSLLCVLLGTMAWGQAQTAPTPAAQPGAAQAPAAPATTTPAQAAEVPESAVVLTIDGVCPAAPATATTASKTAPAKTAAAKKPANCKTVYTRKEFEKIASGLSPNVTPQLKRQLAQALPKFLAMSEAAKAKGLDKTPQYTETLKMAKMQILTTQLQRQVQEEADKVPPQEVEEYYKKNPEAYDQYSLDRLFIPRYKQAPPDKNTEDDKLTEEQQKAKEAEDKARQEEGEKELEKLAESLQQRAAAGEDFAKLQKEAFEASGMKMDSPTINLPTVRRTGLPPQHAAVFDLKAGEVSQVITDNGGHYIYKVVSKTTLPLDDQIKTEIHNTLKSQRMKDMMDKYTNSYKAETNEAYFGPPGPAGPMGGRMGPPQRMQRPNMATPQAQPQTQPPAAPPAQQPPPTKPN